MKRHLITAAAALLLNIPNLTLAQDKAAAPGGPERHGPGMYTPEQRLKMMTEHLGLTGDQQAKIKAIFESHGPAIKELMAKRRDALTEEDKTKLRKMMKASRDEVSAVLTPEQKEKMDKWRAEHGRGGPRGEGKPEAK